jgi:hypothetical protein
MRRLNPTCSVPARTPPDTPRTSVHGVPWNTRTLTSHPDQHEEVEEAVLRRRARGYALLLMVASGIFVITLMTGAWVALHRFL